MAGRSTSKPRHHGHLTTTSADATPPAGASHHRPLKRLHESAQLEGEGGSANKAMDGAHMFLGYFHRFPRMAR